MFDSDVLTVAELRPWRYEDQSDQYLAGSLLAMAQELDEIESGGAVYKEPKSLAALFRELAKRLERP